MDLGTTLTLQVPHPATGAMKSVILVIYSIGRREQHLFHSSDRGVDYDEQ